MAIKEDCTVEEVEHAVGELVEAFATFVSPPLSTVLQQIALALLEPPDPETNPIGAVINDVVEFINDIADRTEQPIAATLYKVAANIKDGHHEGAVDRAMSKAAGASTPDKT